MGKLLPLLMFILALEISLRLFFGVSTPTTSLYDMVYNLVNFNAVALLISLINLATLATLAGIAIGTLSFGGGTDFAIYGGIIATFITYIKVLADVSSRISSQIAGHVSGGVDQLIIGFTILPIALIYIYVILRFWRAGGD